MIDYSLPEDKPNRAFQVGEVGKVRWDVLRFCTGHGLDLGCGPWPLATNCISIDRATGPMFGQAPQANILGDVSSLPLFASGAFDFVFSSHTLEDQEDWTSTLREWWRVIKVGGNLVLYLPHKDLYRGQNSDHKVELDNEIVAAEMKKVGGWDLLVDEVRDQDDEYSFLQVYRKRKDRKTVRLCDGDKPEKTCAVIRCGGIGDHIMAAAILPPLKRDGYHITYITNHSGEQVMRHDPNIDEIWVDTANLSGQQLLDYWQHWEDKFDKVVNVMDAVENAQLPQPGTPQWRWPTQARQMLMDFPYLDFQSLVTQVPMDDPPQAMWHATEEEKKWAQREKKKLGGTVIVWGLAGSAVHKVSPFTGMAVDEVLKKNPEAIVVTVGGEKEKSLYDDFPGNARHIRRAGEWSIRETLAFTTAADMVVGPETGISNAVGMLDTPQVVWMSHSSPINLTARWKNCTAVQPAPEVAPCHPCHMLHWGWEKCHKGPHGAALCVEGIPPEAMAEAVCEVLATKQAA